VSVAAVILAAGFSRRLGRSKQTLVIAGETLLQRAVRTAREAGLTPIIVVVNSQAKVQVDGCILVINEQAAEGMAASIRAGIAVAQDHAVDGALLMTCDQVAVTPEHLRALSPHPHTAERKVFPHTFHYLNLTTCSSCRAMPAHAACCAKQTR
jgi:CTP:molybdopterin cytidylyltransferase MocA